MYFLKKILLGVMVFSCLGGTAQAKGDDTPYVVEEHGRKTWSSTFDKRMPTSAQQWEYAQKIREKGNLKKAERLMLYLVRRWPNSVEAPLAQRARADMFYSRNKLKDAFKQYQYLIDNYSGLMTDYDSVLDCQFKIAVDTMERRRMRWLFGGYRAPEYAVDYFEDIIRNGPQWERAPEAQFLIGKAYQEAKELELAVTAYGVLGYRYPDCPFAEEAAWQRIVCLDKLRQELPNDLEVLERTLTATTVFLTIYPKSERHEEIILLRNKLYEVKAQNLFNQAAFYAKVPKKAKAAKIYYEKMIEEYPKSKLVPEAQQRIEELDRLVNTRVSSPPPTSGKEAANEGR